MRKQELLNYILFSMIIAVVYAIWAIQPPLIDDWFITNTHTFFPLPKTGQEIRYWFSEEYLVPVNPFFLVKPCSLIAVFVVVGLIWATLINEPIFMRAGLTLLTALGFPYLGHIGPWNASAGQYAVSAAWLIVWYIVYRKIHYINSHSVSRGIFFFILTFIVASWHEVWLIAFSGIAAYFLIDAFALLRKRNKPFKLRSLTIHFSIILAYILAVAFYTRKGPAEFIDARQGVPGLTASLFNWHHLIKSFLIGTKESLVLIKDILPLLLLIIFVKLNKNFKSKLYSDSKLSLAAAFGAILLIYVFSFVRGAPDWRVRWLCIFPLSFALYAFPDSVLIERFSLQRRRFPVKVIRLCSIIIAIAWLAYNAYFTYFYTNIDVRGWLQYRQMVLDRNPKAMQGLCCRTLPKNRPKGVASWDHEWGSQDDRYRYFYGSSEGGVYAAIKDIWDVQEIKR